MSLVTITIFLSVFSQSMTSYLFNFVTVGKREKFPFFMRTSETGIINPQNFFNVRGHFKPSAKVHLYLDVITSQSALCFSLKLLGISPAFSFYTALKPYQFVRCI